MEFRIPGGKIAKRRNAVVDCVRTSSMSTRFSELKQCRAVAALAHGCRASGNIAVSNFVGVESQCVSHMVMG